MWSQHKKHLNTSINCGGFPHWHDLSFKTNIVWSKGKIDIDVSVQYAFLSSVYLGGIFMEIECLFMVITTGKSMQHFFSYLYPQTSDCWLKFLHFTTMRHTVLTSAAFLFWESRIRNCIGIAFCSFALNSSKFKNSVLIFLSWSCVEAISKNHKWLKLVSISGDHPVHPPWPTTTSYSQPCTGRQTPQTLFQSVWPHSWWKTFYLFLVCTLHAPACVSCFSSIDVHFWKEFGSAFSVFSYEEVEGQRKHTPRWTWLANW